MVLVVIFNIDVLMNDSRRLSACDRSPHISFYYLYTRSDLTDLFVKGIISIIICGVSAVNATRSASSTPVKI